MRGKTDRAETDIRPTSDHHPTIKTLMLFWHRINIRVVSERHQTMHHTNIRMTPMVSLKACATNFKSLKVIVWTRAEQAWGGVLDACERVVDLEHFGNVLCGLRRQGIVLKTASRTEIGVSAAADSRIRGVGRRTRAPGGSS